MCAYKDDLRESEEGADDSTEMTAMTAGVPQSEAVAVSMPLTGITTPTAATAGSCEPFKKLWLKRHLRTPTGKCVVLFAFLGFIILISYLVTKIVIGIMYLSKCPLESFIPLYLVVSSVLLLLFITLLTGLVLKHHGQQQPVDDEDRVSPIHLISLVYYFIHLVLQLAGSVCVIRTYSQVGSEELELNSGPFSNGLVTTSTTTTTCNATLITFAFGVVIFELVLSGIGFLLTILTLVEVIYLLCFK